MQWGRVRQAIAIFRYCMGSIIWLFEIIYIYIYITLLKIKVKLEYKEKTQVIQGRASDCPELRVIPDVTVCQLRTSAPPDMVIQSLFGEALSCLPPWLIGSHCFHTPAFFHCGDVCVDVWGGTEGTFLCSLFTVCPTPFPRGTGFLARHQVSGMWHWVPRKRKNNLKIPLGLPIVKIQNHVVEQDLWNRLANHLQDVDTNFCLNTLNDRELSSSVGHCWGPRARWGIQKRSLVAIGFCRDVPMVKAFWVSRNPLVIKGEGQCKNTALRGTKDWPLPFLCLSHYVPALASYVPLHTFFLSILTDSNMTPNTCHCSQASTTSRGSVSQYLNFKCLTRSPHWFIMVQISIPNPASFTKVGHMIQRWLPR